MKPLISFSNVGVAYWSFNCYSSYQLFQYQEKSEYSYRMNKHNYLTLGKEQKANTI